MQWQLGQEGWGAGVHEQAFPAGHLDDEPVGRPEDGTLSFVLEESERGRLLERLERLADALSWGPGAWEVRGESVLRTDWETAWREKWRPFRCGGFVIYAEFHGGLAEQLRPEDQPLLVPTGSAFGTGGHPSTRIALRCLRRWSAAQPFDRMLDVGMGTGILAVAAAQLGVREVVGMDPDAPAPAQAIKMATCNGVEKACFFWRGTLESAAGAWPVVFANLQSGLLQRYSRMLHSCLEPGGRLFTGGFMDRNAAPTLEAFAGAGLRLDRLHEHGRWRAAELSRPRH